MRFYGRRHCKVWILLAWLSEISGEEYMVFIHRTVALHQAIGAGSGPLKWGARKNYNICSENSDF